MFAHISDPDNGRNVDGCCLHSIDSSRCLVRAGGDMAGAVIANSMGIFLSIRQHLVMSDLYDRILRMGFAS